MKDARKTSSIARRIAWSFQTRRLPVIFAHTALLCAAAVIGWCAAVCQALTGSIFPAVPAKIEAGERVYVTWRLIRMELAGQSAFRDCVILRLADGQSAPMGDFLFWLLTGAAIYLLVRLGLWLIASSGATRRVRRFLRPIDDIALVTESISSGGLDESRFHTLEEAIDHINGVSTDERVQIGDADLAGLETAVNNLIVRMHNAYRKQVRFVDDASHELRTPIAVIAGYADMLDRWGKTDEQVLDEGIRAIRTETAHMKTLVEQLLFLARGDSGRQSLDMQKLDVCALTKEVWEESRMIDAAHEYVLKADGMLNVTADEAMLKQAVRILVENAMKYSPEGSRITLRAYADGGCVCIDVQDNGIGVSERDAEHMFDRFYRADKARSSETGGSGLGLSIAQWIIGRHGGHFRVVSREDIGTRVTIVLPQRRG